MSNATFREISELIQKHLEARDWHHNPPRGLAVSIVLEAAELLEHYQWEEEPVGDKQAVADELADILIYAFQLASLYDIDLPRAITSKLKRAAKKYPAKDFKNKTETERRKLWVQKKLQHKKTGL